MIFAIVGAGSWGTAIAQLLAENGHHVKLWAHDEAVARGINQNHSNPFYLKDAKLSDNISASNDIAAVLKDTDAVAIVTPSIYLRRLAKSISPHLNSDTPVVICSKGAEEQSGELVVQVIAEEIGNEDRIGVLSGPTHAEEVIKGIPTAATCAAAKQKIATFFQEAFSSASFRVYTSTDVCGVEICGAFKNIIAIGVGLAYGLGLGDNTAALIITRGIAEMARLVVASGGDIQTCQGLSGVGDMIATCTSRHSRNRVFGEDYLAKGKNMDDFSKDTRMVVEGAVAAKNIRLLAKNRDVDLPITDAIYSIIYLGADPTKCANELFSRPLREEF